MCIRSLQTLHCVHCTSLFVIISVWLQGFQPGGKRKESMVFEETSPLWAWKWCGRTPTITPPPSQLPQFSHLNGEGVEFHQHHADLAVRKSHCSWERRVEEGMYTLMYKQSLVSTWSVPRFRIATLLHCGYLIRTENYNVTPPPSTPSSNGICLMPSFTLFSDMEKVPHKHTQNAKNK